MIETLRIEPVLPPEGCDIDAILATVPTLEKVSLARGEEFTGRPSTQIYANEDYVLKLHSEYQFNAASAHRWLTQKIEQEQSLRVHHPLKLWFLAETDDKVHIGNIVPRLRPLHKYIDNCDTENALHLLADQFRLIVKVGAEQQQLLDAGLSNFGLDETGDKLYYLDDDVYKWDRFISLAQSAAHLFRSLEWLTEEHCFALGERAKQDISEYFDNTLSTTIFHSHLTAQALLTDAQNARRQSYCSAFFAGSRNHAAAIAKAPDPDPSEETEQSPSTDKPIALLADPHANAPALEAVLEQIAGENVGRILVLGDVVGYGPHPQQCIDMLRDSGCEVIMGNHDYAISRNEFIKGFSSLGRQAGEWNHANIDEQGLEWLSGLPLYIREPQWLAVHGAPMDPAFFLGYVYHMTYEDNLDYLAERNIRWCFHGHTHIQSVYYRNGKIDKQCTDGIQNLSEFEHALICPGSVGQPRENNGPDARYALFDPNSGQLELRSIRYDYNQTANDILAGGLPSEFAQRLEQGT